MKKYLILFLFSSLKLFSQGKGIEIYSLKKYENPNRECKNCFDIRKDYLSDMPILQKTDIAKFDWQNQQFILTSEGKKKLENLDIPLSGLPVVLVINDEPIYGFWFWTLESSFTCDRVFTFPKIDFKLNFGLPSGYIFGADPRYDLRIENFLNSKK